MKTTLSHLSLLVIFITTANIAWATPHTPPVRSLEIPPTNQTIIMDGVADAAYGASQSMDAFSGNPGYPDADFTSSFQVCFNYQKLYILFTVLDDYACEIPYTTSADPWTYDNIEVFLSIDTTGTTTAYDTNTIQLRFNRGIQDSAQTPGRAAQEDYLVYSENTADGYVIEVGIPWTAVLQEGVIDPQGAMETIVQGGVVNGFDVHGNDNDTDGGPGDCQTAWDNDDPAMPDATEDLAWNNRTMFGVMNLVTETNIETRENQFQIVYPNPASKIIQLQNAEPASTIAIYNLLGVKILETKLVNSEDYIDISSLKTGLYTVIINNKDVSRFVKE